MAQKTHLFDTLVVRSWWTILFILLCFFAYDRASARRAKERGRLEEKLASLLKQKEAAEKRRTDLHLQIASQDDPAYIELTLMRALGLVPEGQTKVLFRGDSKLLKD